MTALSIFSLLSFVIVLVVYREENGDRTLKKKWRETEMEGSSQERFFKAHRNRTKRKELSLPSLSLRLYLFFIIYFYAAHARRTTFGRLSSIDRSMLLPVRNSPLFTRKRDDDDDVYIYI